MERETPMQPTRWEILQLLKKRGRATVDELSKALNMTLMGVRLHLVVLDRDGYVQRSTVREKPGRPALVYSLTPSAEDIFPKRYDLLAETLLDALRMDGDQMRSRAVLTAAAHRMAEPLARNLDGVPLARRVEATGDALNDIGAFASWEEVEGGYLIHQYNCLFYRVALHNREVCSLDHAFLKEVLGVDAIQRECLLDGASRCSFFVPQ
jgi:predicted ArsR family transcriptional regulator